MIIAKLNGGLGNQMFQYANGKALALKLNTKLLLDISEFSVNQHHQGFELSRIFDGPFDVASKKDIKRVIGTLSYVNYQRVLQRLPNIFLKRSYVYEPCFSYWDGIADISDNSYLVGYWQSEKYFQNYASQIASNFTFSLPLSGFNEIIGNQIRDIEITPISIHVRRGDYISNQRASIHHGVCSLEYYNAAISYFSKKFLNVHFFIFSDDPVWVKENFKLNFPCTFISHNQGESSYIDMRLMSMCNHHIIANSSFSWWGAWLNRHAEKRVIAPKEWFRANLNTQDLLPSNWIRL